MLLAIQDAKDSAMLGLLMRAVRDWPADEHDAVMEAMDARADALAKTTAPPPVSHAGAVAQGAAIVAGINPCPWEVISNANRVARCKKHLIELKRKEGVSQKGKPYVRFDCPARDANGNERGYCLTGGLALGNF